MSKDPYRDTLLTPLPAPVVRRLDPFRWCPLCDCRWDECLDKCTKCQATSELLVQETRSRLQAKLLDLGGEWRARSDDPYDPD